MPLYEYNCIECGATFTELVSAQDRFKPIPCPSCKSKRTRRILSNFATNNQIKSSRHGWNALNKSSCKPSGG
ncbi:MAG: zinc ribbon domain-containing protein [bacterium]